MRVVNRQFPYPSATDGHFSIISYFSPPESGCVWENWPLCCWELGLLFTFSWLLLLLTTHAAKQNKDKLRKNQQKHIHEYKQAHG